MDITDWLTPAAIFVTLTTFVGLSLKQSNKIGQLEAKTETTCYNISKLIERVDKIIDNKKST